MNENPSASGLPGSRTPDPSAGDVDPRFDDAAAGTAPPRPDASAPDGKPLPQQLQEFMTAAEDWVRGKPTQALAVAAGLGFLLGRSGR